MAFVTRLCNAYGLFDISNMFWCYIYVDLFHEASAFHNGVPPHLVIPGAKHTKEILNLRMTRIIALGVHVNDALIVETAKIGNPDVIIEHLPHLTCMSIFPCGEKTAENMKAGS